MDRYAIMAIMDGSYNRHTNELCLYEIQDLTTSVMSPEANGSTKQIGRNLVHVMQTLLGHNNFAIDTDTVSVVCPLNKIGDSFNSETQFFETQNATISTLGTRVPTKASIGINYKHDKSAILFDKTSQKRLLQEYCPNTYAPFLTLETATLNKPLHQLEDALQQIKTFIATCSKHKEFVFKLPAYNKGLGNLFIKSCKPKIILKQIKEFLDHAVKYDPLAAFTKPYNCTAFLEACVNHTPVGQKRQVFRIAALALYEDTQLTFFNIMHTNTCLLSETEYNSHANTEYSNFLTGKTYDYKTKTTTPIIDPSLKMTAADLENIKTQIRALFQNIRTQSQKPEPPVRKTVRLVPHYIEEFPVKSHDHNPYAFRSEVKNFCYRLGIQETINIVTPSKPSQEECHHYKKLFLASLKDIIKIKWLNPDNHMAILQALNNLPRLKKAIWRQLIMYSQMSLVKTHLPYASASPVFALGETEIFDWLTIDDELPWKLPQTLAETSL